MRHLLFISAFALTLTACGGEEPATEAPAAEAPAPVAAAPEPAPAPEPAKSPEDTYKETHAAAVEALDKAASVGGEWRDARWGKSKAVKCGDKKMSILAAAECEAAAGDFDKAVKLAEKARKQGELGYQQSMDYDDAAPHY